MLEGVPFINGAPQNTFVPGAIALAERHNAFIGGDDFKSGQTKVKSVLAEYLVNAGIKPRLIASYNHLGNNDGRNLNATAQFRSKEISKASVVDDMVEANEPAIPYSIYNTCQDSLLATPLILDLTKRQRCGENSPVLAHIAWVYLKSSTELQGNTRTSERCNVRSPE
ncbi:hypothetical protein JCM11641_008271 [Rhodosporidiobolus odoratus]